MRAKSVMLNMSKVREFTYKKYWTIAELARRAHISQATIFALQSNRRRASYKTLLGIANALGVEPSEIVKEEQP